jgi:hypothetical protein
MIARSSITAAPTSSSCLLISPSSPNKTESVAQTGRATRAAGEMFRGWRSGLMQRMVHRVG